MRAVYHLVQPDFMYTGHTYFSSYTELILGTAPLNHIGGYIVPSFFTDLFRSTKFVTQYKARWLEIKDTIMAEFCVSKSV